MKGRVALAILLVSGSANAQVNAEALRSALTTTPKFLWLQSSLAGNAGNTSTLTYSGSIFGGILEEPHLVFAKASADFGEASGITNTAKWVTHARYTYRASELVSLEGFVQVQHDRFRRLAIRDLYGAGLRFAIYQSTDTEVFAGTSYMVEHEVIGEVTGSPGTNNVWNRSNDYIGVNFNITSFVNASSVIYAQPRWAHPLDFRILSGQRRGFHDHQASFGRSERDRVVRQPTSSRGPHLRSQHQEHPHDQASVTPSVRS